MINSNNTNTTHIHNKGRSFEGSSTETPTETSNIQEPTMPTMPNESKVFKRTFENNMVPGDDLSCLYQYMYLLYKGQKIDLTQLDTKSVSSSLLGCIKTTCIKLMKNFERLGNEDRSYLNILLSGCINTIASGHQLTLINMMGVDRLEQMFESCKATVTEDEAWALLRQKMQKALKDGGIVELRTMIIKERLVIYTSGADVNDNVQLKIFDMFEYILNMVQYQDWSRSDISEDQYCLYWKTVFNILFRGKGVTMRQGEPCSQASKFHRQGNEAEFGETSSNVMGRRMDFSFACTVQDEKNKPFTIDLCSAEIKPESVNEETKIIQLNKNIRTNKTILEGLINLNFQFINMPKFTN